MKSGKSEVVIVLDRSGSMSSIKTDMEGGFKTFLSKQKNEPGECFVSLYQFDTQYEVVFENRSIKDVDSITLNPRGSTALLDAIGKTINATGERLKNTPEEERPELVIVCVITDGGENASREFVQAKIAEMVKHQTEKYSWKFLFLGANQDAVLAGTSMGYAAASSLTYAATSAGVKGTFDVFATGVSCMRAMATCSGAMSFDSYSFSEAQRNAAMGAPVQTSLIP